MPTIPYIIDFSDSTKASFTITPGSTSTTDTSLKLFGQNVPLYGEGVNENFLHLLENFANSTPPLNPIEGQIWFNNVDGLLNVYQSINGNPPTWTTAPNVVVTDDIGSVTNFTPHEGSLWLKPSLTIGDPNYDPNLPNEQIYVFTDADGWVHIGRNYVTLNGAQTINDNKTFTGDVDITGNTTVIDLTADTVTVNSSFSAVTGNITGVLNTVSIINTGSFTTDSLTVNSLSSFAGAIFSNAIQGVSLDLTSTLEVDGISTFNDTVIVSKPSMANTALSTTGGVNVSGNLVISGLGYGNLTVAGTSSLNLVNINNDVNMTNPLSIIWAKRVDLGGSNLTNIADPVNLTDGASKNYIDSLFLCRTSVLGSPANNMTAILTLSNVAQSDINGSPADTNAATVKYVKDTKNLCVLKAGDIMTGHLQITNGTGVSLTTSGDVYITGDITNVANITTTGTTESDAVVANDLTVHTSMSIDTGGTIDMGNNPVENVTMKPVPIGTDAANVAYVQTLAAAISATETQAGVAEIATTAEVAVGTDDSRIVTPLKLSQRLAAVLASLNSSSHGKVQLIKYSNTEIRLIPYDGNTIVVNSTPEVLTASVNKTISNIDVDPSTVYYVYVFKSGVNLQLELSTTSYIRDASTGVVVKTGDATRTLVGMLNTTVSETVDMVRSYFNDEGTTLIDKIDNSYVYNPNSITSTTALYQSRYQNNYPAYWYYVVPSLEYTMPEMEIQYLAWENEIVNLGLHFNGADAGANTDFWFHLVVDGVRHYETGCTVGTTSEDEYSGNYVLQHQIATSGLHTLQMGVSMPAKYGTPYGVWVYRTTNITVFTKR